MPEVFEMENFVDHYALLNVVHDADDGEITRAYRTKIQSVHPDRNRGLDGAEDLTRLVINARDVLLDPVRRRTYDVEWKAKSRARTEREAARRAAEAHARAEREAEARATEHRARADREARAAWAQAADAWAAEAQAARERAAEARASWTRAAETRGAEARKAWARAAEVRAQAQRQRRSSEPRTSGQIPTSSPVLEAIGAVLLVGLVGLGVAVIADALSDGRGRPRS